MVRANVINDVNRVVRCEKPALTTLPDAVKLLSQIPEANAGETRVDKESNWALNALVLFLGAGEVRDEGKAGRVGLYARVVEDKAAQLNAKGGGRR